MAKDSLARGARSATFTPNKNVTQSQWDAVFEDFDPDAFRKRKGIETIPDPNAERCLVHTGIK
jgi:hypothetical protein